MSPRPDTAVRRRRPAAVLAAALAVASVAGAVVGGARPAGAASADHASLTYAWFDRSTDTVHVRGYARHGSSPAAVSVRVYVDGRFRHTSWANHSSVAYDRSQHVAGKHMFFSAFRAPAAAHTLTLSVNGRRLASATLARYADQGARIVAFARTHVGARYSYGAAGPRAFDCSGFTSYVYRQADVASLPHNTDAQLHRMRRLSARSARAGDLVFYMSGASSYHVAIYAGRGMQYAAATPRQGVVYQHVWSSHVVYATDWH